MTSDNSITKKTKSNKTTTDKGKDKMKSSDNNEVTVIEQNNIIKEADTRKKILFAATHPNEATGYSKVGWSITDYLRHKYKVYYFAFQRSSEDAGRNVHSDIEIIDVRAEEKEDGEILEFGDNLIKKHVKRIKPDMIIIYNDVFIISRLYQKLVDLRKEDEFKNMKCHVYLDLVYPYQKQIYINLVNSYVDKIITFANFWKQNLLDMKIPESKVSYLHHGIDNIPIIDKDEARKELRIPNDDNPFIFYNANRNAYRKGLDITIRAFLSLYKRIIKEINPTNEVKNIPNIKLMLSCLLNSESGIDILEYINLVCEEFELDPKFIMIDGAVIIHPSLNKRASDRIIHLAYNASDVGINTSYGEGFGLCPIEHGSVGKPQIVTNVGPINELLSDKAYKINISAELYTPSHVEKHGGYMKLCNYKEVEKAMYFYLYNRDKGEEDGNKLKEHIRKNYMWDAIYQKIDKELISSI